MAVITNLVNAPFFRKQFIAAAQFPDFIRLCGKICSSVAESLVYSSEAELLEKALAVMYNCGIEPECLPVMFSSPKFVADLCITAGSMLSKLLTDRALAVLSRATRTSTLTGVFIANGGIETCLKACAPLALRSVWPVPAPTLPTTVDDLPWPVKLSSLRCVARALAAACGQKGGSSRVKKFRYSPTEADRRSAKDADSTAGSKQDNKVTTVKGITAVVRLLGIPDSKIQGNVALCIAHLALDKGCISRLDVSIDPLTRLLKADNAESKPNVVCALARLSAAKPAYREAIRSSGAMQLLYLHAAKQREAKMRS